MKHSTLETPPTAQREALLESVISAIKANTVVLMQRADGNFHGKGFDGLEVTLTRSRDALYQVGIRTREGSMWIRCPASSALYAKWDLLHREAVRQQEEVLALRFRLLVNLTQRSE